MPSQCPCIRARDCKGQCIAHAISCIAPCNPLHCPMQSPHAQTVHCPCVSHCLKGIATITVYTSAHVIATIPHPGRKLPAPASLTGNAGVATVGQLGVDVPRRAHAVVGAILQLVAHAHPARVLPIRGAHGGCERQSRRVLYSAELYSILAAASSSAVLLDARGLGLHLALDRPDAVGNTTSK